MITCDIYHESIHSSTIHSDHNVLSTTATPQHMLSSIYLFSSSALFFRFSLVSGAGKLSAWTGPCLCISPAFHASVSIMPERTGLALCALAPMLPPLEMCD
jgi:hypothetical protein